MDVWRWSERLLNSTVEHLSFCSRRFGDPTASTEPHHPDVFTISFPITHSTHFYDVKPPRPTGINRNIPSSAMRLSPTTLLITALGWITAVTAHNIQLKAHSRECFHETLHKDDRMSISFQVGDREFGGSGNLDIDFWVRTGRLLFFSHAAGSDKKHANGCFSSLLSSSRTRCLTVNITNKRSLRTTIPSLPSPTGNTTTASATRDGRLTPRRCLSTCMESCMFQRRKWNRIPWTQKVRRLCARLPTPLLRDVGLLTYPSQQTSPSTFGSIGPG